MEDESQRDLPPSGFDKTEASSGEPSSGMEDTLAHDEAESLAETLDPAELPTELPSRETPPFTEGELPEVPRSFYRFGKEFARGGMGRIVEARDLRLDRTIAIKELHSQHEDLERRFEREVRLTARLQHPSIISVLEAGKWKSGELFYTMKRVEGRAFEEAIRNTKTTADRLALLPTVQAVADALAYAHSQGIIHRDLKPANVLVGSFGETVVIDWGLAKYIGENEASVDLTDSVRERSNDALTLVGTAMGTPSYMPPEQAKGREVDERADVYAIGAMLYHLLCGEAPYLDKSPKTAGELLRLVESGPPSPLSDRVDGLPPDLLTIIDTAMSRAPEERYASAQDLAADLRRFERGQLVGVHDYSLGALIRRFIRQHKAILAVALGALVVLGIVGGLAIQRIREERTVAQTQKQRALARKADVEELIDFMLGDLKFRLLSVGKLEMLGPVIEKAHEYYGSQVEEEESLDQRHRRANSLFSLGQLYELRGRHDQARATFEEEIALRIDVARQRPEDFESQKALQGSHQKLGELLLSLGHVEDARSQYEAALEIAKREVQHHPSLPSAHLTLASAHNHLGQLLRHSRIFDGAIEHLKESGRIASGLAAQHPSNLAFLQTAGDAQSAFAEVLLEVGDAEGAIRAGRKAVELLEFDKTESKEWIQRKSVARSRLAKGLLASGRAEDALPLLEQALAYGRQLNEHDPDNLQWARELGMRYQELGDCFFALGQAQAGFDHYKKTLENTRALGAKEPGNPVWQYDLVLDLQRVAAVLASSQPKAALHYYDEATSVLGTLLEGAPDNADWRRDIGVLLYEKTGLYESIGDTAKAVQSIDDAIVHAQRLAERKNHTEQDLHYYGVMLRRQGRLEVATKKAEQGTETLRKSHDILASLTKQSPDNEELTFEHAMSAKRLASVLESQGETEEALSLFEQCSAAGARDEAEAATVELSASCAALAGNRDKAFELLVRYVQSGEADPEELEASDAYAALRADSRWQKLVAPQPTATP